ncbi:MAG: NAD(P)H-hydrate dehydratase [Anaerolineaceae bacterium]|nr:NAD(P)H-hydrate dehydratase [Anaerolineaceae bacterium]
MQLVSVAEMKAIETEANEKGLTYAQMMENAGNALGNYLANAYSHIAERTALGLIGPGNNGGDTLIALAQLAEAGWRVSAYLVKNRTVEDEPLKRLRSAGGEVLNTSKDADLRQLQKAVGHVSLILDGVLGTGNRLPLKEELTRILRMVKSELTKGNTCPVIIAVDCPSGVDCDTGEASPVTLQADETICMAAVKIGLLYNPALALSGEISVVDIGISDEVQSSNAGKTSVMDVDCVLDMLPERSPDAHKGTFGTALIVAGSVNFTGAAMLAGEGAYRVGTGLVTLGVPSLLHQALAGAFPEATWLLLPHEMGVISENAADVIIQHMKKVDAILLGSGWGMEETTQSFLSKLLRPGQPRERGSIGFVHAQASGDTIAEITLPPLVIDADGLKLLAKIDGWADLLPEQTVLTPHPGEMAILTGKTIQEIRADRIGIARKYSKEWNKVVVLKGAGTLIAAPDGRITAIPVATAALAKAGTGDVLAGIITGLRAQGLDGFSSAAAGAWLHAQAGLMALEQVGNSASVLAGDVARAIPDVLNQIGYAT